MLEKVHTVVVPVVPLDEKLVRNLHALVPAGNGELVQAGGITDPHVRLIQVAHVGGIHACGNPALTEVEVQFLEGNAPGLRVPQGLKRLSHIGHPSTVGIAVYPCLDALRLFYHIAGYETVLDLVTVRQRVEIDAVFQGGEQFLLRPVGNGAHILQIDTAVFVERGGQGFFGRACMDVGSHRKGNGMFEDVRLDEFPFFGTLQR